MKNYTNDLLNFVNTLQLSVSDEVRFEELKTEINSLNYKYDDGSPVMVGDTAHCYDTDGTINPIITTSLTGVVTEVDGVLLVDENELALTCAMHVEKVCKL